MWTLAEWADVATVVSALILVFTLPLLLMQLRQMSRASRLQLLDPVIKQFNSEPSVRAREYVVNTLPLLKDLNEEARKHIDCVSRDFNDLGFLLYSGLVEEGDIIPNWGMSCIRHWERLKPYVEKIQASDYPHRRIFFRLLAIRSDRWLRRHLRELLDSVPPYDGNAQDVMASIRK